MLTPPVRQHMLTAVSSGLKKSARQIRVVTPVCVMVTNVIDEALDEARDLVQPR